MKYNLLCNPLIDKRKIPAIINTNVCIYGARVTIQDIAKIANVHVSTVSRSLNNSNRVAEKTRARIQKIARENGFEFNASARGLITSRVNTIAIVLPRNFEHFYVNLFHSALHNYLRKTLEREDIDLLVSFQNNRYSGGSNIMRLIRRKKIDGLILFEPNIDAEVMEYIIENDIPYIFSHYPPENDLYDSDVVQVDHLYGGTLVGEAFLKKERTNILCMTPHGNDKEYMLRIEGLRKVFSDSGYKLPDENICFTAPDYEGGYQEVLKFRQGIKQYDGIFALTDFIAYGVINACHDIGIVVPDDLGVIGYDDTSIALYMHPPLTTIHQPIDEIAQLTCERLIQKIKVKGKNEAWDVQTISIKPEMVYRGSFLA